MVAAAFLTFPARMVSEPNAEAVQAEVPLECATLGVMLMGSVGLAGFLFASD